MSSCLLSSKAHKTSKNRFCDDFVNYLLVTSPLKFIVFAILHATTKWTEIQLKPKRCQRQAACAKGEAFSAKMYEAVSELQIPTLTAVSFGAFA